MGYIYIVYLVYHNYMLSSQRCDNSIVMLNSFEFINLILNRAILRYSSDS